MMSKELGGVVDTEGKVYGTMNVRVVDSSRAHPTAVRPHHAQIGLWMRVFFRRRFLGT
jgi:hypothetical protein